MLRCHPKRRNSWFVAVEVKPKALCDSTEILRRKPYSYCRIAGNAQDLPFGNICNSSFEVGRAGRPSKRLLPGQASPQLVGTESLRHHKKPAISDI
jgi:hypothetical protein